jgi:hypothetical protein
MDDGTPRHPATVPEHVQSCHGGRRLAGCDPEGGERERERGSKTTAGAPVWLAGLVMGMHVRLRAFAMPLDHGVVVVASAQRPVSV